MTFAVWTDKPPFTFAQTDAEQIYPVGNVWIVTDTPALGTQGALDDFNAVKASAVAAPTIEDVIAILAPDQKAALDSRVAGKVKQ